MEFLKVVTSASTKKQLIEKICDFAKENGITKEESALLNDLLHREKQGSTGFEDGVAIPHSISDSILKNTVIVAQNIKAVKWQSIDGKNIDTAVAILIAKNSHKAESHIEWLAAVAACLIEKSNLKIFKNGSTEEISEIIQKSFKENQKNAKSTKAAKTARMNQSSKDHIDFVGVTACPAGLAHTNMSAEALEKFARDNNLTVKIERQSAAGTQNEITMEEVAKTDHVILAIDREIEGMERFAGKKLLETSTTSAIKNAASLWEKVKNCPVYKAESNNSGSSSLFSNTSSGFVSGKKKIKLMQAVMTGLSYMLPVIVIGGVLFGFATGIGRLALGYNVFDNKDSAWHTLAQIGLGGIQASVVILGMFIANAIGGKVAMAPTVVLCFATQGILFTSTNWTFFNFDKLTFGVDGSNLSFFGSVAAGFLCGFGARYWTMYVSPHVPKLVRSIEAILVIPLLLLVVGWALFAFALYVPLYYLSIGLRRGVDILVENNVLWVAGAIGGAMFCFDLGGPVNKIAFGIGVALTADGKTEFMGAAGAAGAVGPLGMVLGWALGAKVFKIKNLVDDGVGKESIIPSTFMGLLGLSEGAIPYTIKNPRSAVPSNVVGGAVAGAVAGAFLVTNSSLQTGPFGYIIGAYGKNGLTDYVYGLIFLAALLAGSVVTAVMFVTIELILQKYNPRDPKHTNVDYSKIWSKWPIKRNKKVKETAVL